VCWNSDESSRGGIVIVKRESPSGASQSVCKTCRRRGSKGVKAPLRLLQTEACDDLAFFAFRFSVVVPGGTVIMARHELLKEHCGSGIVSVLECVEGHGEPFAQLMIALAYGPAHTDEFDNLDWARDAP
jgi:hypothetical protein